MLMSSPHQTQRQYQATYAMSSHLDLVPTVLDWFSVPYPATDVSVNSPVPNLPGKSLLPLLIKGNVVMYSFLKDGNERFRIEVCKSQGSSIVTSGGKECSKRHNSSQKSKGSKTQSTLIRTIGLL